MNKGGLLILQLNRDITGKTEVWILVDGTWNETRNVASGAENVRERVGEGRSGLDGCEVDLSDVVPVRKLSGLWAGVTTISQTE